MCADLCAYRSALGSLCAQISVLTEVRLVSASKRLHRHKRTRSALSFSFKDMTSIICLQVQGTQRFQALTMLKRYVRKLVLIVNDVLLSETL
jgi:hypothetical protein